MKVRIISSLVGLLILVVVFIFLDTLIFNAVMGAIGLLAVLELLNAAKFLEHKELSTLCLLIAIVIPFVQEKAVRVLVPQILFILVISMFVILLIHHRRLRVEQAAMAFLFSVIVPLFFSSAVFMRNSFGPYVGGLYILWALGAAWLSDTGAYFSGRTFGKHKLAPLISPKKTVEGAIGGVLTSTVGMALLSMLYQYIMASFFTPVSVNYTLLLLLTPVFSVMGIMGDLSASVIKRQFDVKDYGHIMPGHGGILDRFDSVLFTVPSVFIVTQYITVAALR